MDENNRTLGRHGAVTSETEVPDGPFRVDVWPDRDAAHVCPVGEVDLDTADHIRERLDQLRSAGFTRLILDLRAVTFLDSSGIALVLETDALARADGFDFAVIEGPPRVRRVFEITGLRAALTFIDPSQVGGAWWQ